VIIRYDGSRIFHGEELQRSSTSGKIGESVPVEVLRNGEIVRLYIDRGPMGFGLKHRLMWPHLLP
jgi:S1-C subfamily serine protease